MGELSIEIGFGVSLVQNSRAKKDQMEGISIIEKAVEGGTESLGLCLAACMATMVLTAYLAAGLYEEGVERANKLEKQMKQCGAEGKSTVGNLYKLKAELMIGMMEKKKKYDEPTVREVENLLQLAIQTAVDRKIRTNELKARVAMTKFWQKVEQQSKLEQSTLQLRETVREL